MKQAIFRIFLIVLPLIPIALIVSSDPPTREKLDPESQDYYIQKTSSILKKNCPFFLSISPEPIAEEIDPTAPFHSFLTEEKRFIKKIKLASKKFQHNTKPSIFLPIYLTKDSRWIVSWKSFVLTENLERKEISHLDYKEIQNYFLKNNNAQMLNLKKVMQTFPRHNLFLQIEGKDEKRYIEHLSFLKTHKNFTYVFSSNDDFLQKIQHYPKVITIQSFQKIVRIDLLSLISPRNSFSSIEGEGILVPHKFPVSKNTMLYISEQKKLFIVKSDDPINNISDTWLDNINGLISSNIKSIEEFIEQKKTCFMDNS